MDAGVVLQTLLSGLSAGAVLALVALGFALVAGTVRVLDLAHGDVVLAAVLTAVLAVLGTSPVATLLAPGAAAAFLGVALAAGVALGVAVGLLAVRPFARDPLGWLAGTVTAGLLLREVLGLLLPGEGYAVPDPLRLSRLTTNGVVALPAGAVLDVRVPAVLAIALAVAVAAERLVVGSRLGRSLRAVADDPEAAALCGVDPRRVLLVAFAVAGLLAGVAGVLDAPGRAVGVDDGTVLGLSGAAAALLGGLTGSSASRLRGAVLGGLVIGVLQAAVVQWRGAAWSDVVPLGLLVVLLAAGRR